MISSCLVCLEPIGDEGRTHARCNKRLFGTLRPPELRIELAKLHTAALAMVGHTSLSGVQRKISVRLDAEARRLQVAAEGGLYILKPQAQTFPNLPENEHVTMLLAARAGIEVPPCGLVALRDGSLAYVVRRFDRLADGGKLDQEDFCQLAQRSPKDKYSGSAELCAKLTLRYASEPLVETLKLFRLVVFAWLTGNGDMHLKNFSILRGGDGVYRLSPAYDLLCTRLVIPEDPLALSVGGKKKELTRRQWIAYAAVCQLPERAACRVLDEIVSGMDEAASLIASSFLPEEMNTGYTALVGRRARALGAR